MDKNKLLTDLGEVFSPAAPIRSKDLFLGRQEQLDKVIEAILERGQHIVLYGDRGVGKTSLANIIGTGLTNVIVAKVTCNRTQSFREIWDAALNKINFEYKTQGLGFTAVEKTGTIQLNLFLPEVAEITSLDVQNVLEKVDNHLLFIFDEFDSVTDNSTRIKFADTIKSLSDNAPKVSVLIVGIAKNVNELIGNHPSLERCIKQILMPTMNNDELNAIINKGLGVLNMTIDREVAEKIINFSLGFPHFTHLLIKFSAKVAILDESPRITDFHFSQAIAECIENVNQSIRDSYQKATIASKKEARFEDIIGACAIAASDEFETFSTNDLLIPYFELLGENTTRESLTYYLNKLCTEQRDCFLEKVGTSSTKNIRYRFSHPLMKAYARLKLFQKDKLKYSLFAKVE